MRYTLSAQPIDKLGQIGFDEFDSNRPPGGVFEVTSRSVAGAFGEMAGVLAPLIDRGTYGAWDLTLTLSGRKKRR
jgi:hypothetical protein